MEKKKEPRLYTQFNTPPDMPSHGLELIDGIPVFELWSLDSYLAEHIVDRLKAFKKANPIGWNAGKNWRRPSKPYKNKASRERAFARRNKYTQDMLDKMIFAFEFYANDPISVLAKIPQNERDDYLKKVKEGKKAFVDHFGLLWW